MIQTVEVIDTTYDKTNHTITFNTASFSNYAIASKKTENTTNTENDNKGDNTANTEIDNKVENTTNSQIDNKIDNTTNPQTGDNIIIFIIIFVLALTGILGIFINKKKVKNNK